MKTGWKSLNKKVAVLVCIAALLEFGAVMSALKGSSLFWFLVVASLHSASVISTVLAARFRTKLTQCELDAVFISALFIPVWGPLLAWRLPRPPEDEEEEEDDELTTLERYEDYIRPHIPDYERSLFTGDYDTDMARELDTETYTEVLWRGDTDQKRNALARLADLGEARHLQLVRSVLKDPSHEMRLYAYSELEKVVDRCEEEIDERSLEVDKQPTDGEAVVALARAHYKYAVSGVLDPEMASYHFRLALGHASSPAAESLTGPESWVLAAVCLAALKELDEAHQKLDEIPSEYSLHPDVCIARAEVAFVERDFDEARNQAKLLTDFGIRIPRWLAALTIEKTDEPVCATQADSDADTESDTDTDTDTDAGIATASDLTLGSESAADSGLSTELVAQTEELDLEPMDPEEEPVAESLVIVEAVDRSEPPSTALVYVTPRELRVIPAQRLLGDGMQLPESPKEPS